jgi:lipid-A-disaccharide synthase
MNDPQIMFVAGDPSGDQHAAPIISRLKEMFSSCSCFGIGGPKMQAEGFEALLPFEGFTRMGYVEVITHLFFFLNAKKLLIDQLRRRKPAVLVCVDYSGFNTPIMKAAHRLQIPVVWYIAPKIWAWKKKKHTTNLKNYASHIATIFPFEVDLFLPYTKNVSFVGNPLIEFMDNNGFYPDTTSTANLLKKAGINLAIVPGSRMQEILSMLPVMAGAYSRLKKQYPKLTGRVSICDNIPHTVYENLVSGTDIIFFKGSLEEMYKNSDIAYVTSGTATLQTALMGVPMVIAYKTSPLSYLLYRMLIKNLKYIGLPNIIAQNSIVPECIQSAMNTETLVQQMKKFIDDPEYYRFTVQKLVALKETLGSKKPSEEMVGIIKRVGGL